jgi:hypothetical protein
MSITERLEALELRTALAKGIRINVLTFLRNHENPDTINWAKTLIMQHRERSLTTNEGALDIGEMLGLFVKSND